MYFPIYLPRNQANMKEDLLHFVWRTKKFNLQHLCTTQGEEIRIEQFGIHNHQQGPDFNQAKIWIGEMLWVGNVEMHLLSSDWYKHKHQNDLAYENVILHVVWEEDMPVLRSDESRIPCLELKGRIPQNIIVNYQYLQASETWVPCEKMLFKINDFTLRMWLESLAVERLQIKSTPFERLYLQTAGDIEATFYRVLLTAYGLPYNKEAFEQLAIHLPLSLLEKYSTDQKQIEALMFGQSGLLNDRRCNDEYYLDLQKEFGYLQEKHSLQPMSSSVWRFGGMRPMSFPTLRIAQFAAIFAQHTRVFDDFLQAKSIDEYKAIFDHPVSDYWRIHYRFGDKGQAKNTTIGESSIDVILINTVLPFLFYYGGIRSLEHLQDRSLKLLQNIKAEKNKITQNWHNIGVQASSALDSQALIQLKKNYCTQRRCMDCAIGASLIQL